MALPNLGDLIVWSKLDDDDDESLVASTIAWIVRERSESARSLNATLSTVLALVDDVPDLVLRACAFPGADPPLTHFLAQRVLPLWPARLSPKMTDTWINALVRTSVWDIRETARRVATEHGLRGAPLIASMAGTVALVLARLAVKAHKSGMPVRDATHTFGIVSVALFRALFFDESHWYANVTEALSRAWKTIAEQVQFLQQQQLSWRHRPVEFVPLEEAIRDLQSREATASSRPIYAP